MPAKKKPETKPKGKKDEPEADPHEATLAVILAADDTAVDGGEATTGAGGLTAGGALKGVLSGLSAEGGYSFIELIGLIPKIVTLLAVIGPQVADIIAKVKELWPAKG